jgi:hypothetical protein
MFGSSTFSQVRLGFSSVLKQNLIDLAFQLSWSLETISWALGQHVFEKRGCARMQLRENLSRKRLAQMLVDDAD